MARLPFVGGDPEAWGAVLNDYLRVNTGEDGTLNAYTLAGLPAAGVAGRLARVTNDNNRIYVDTGAAWVPITLPDSAILAPAAGGTGLNTSGSAGVPVIAAGIWSILAQLSAARGGTGLDTSASTGTARLDAGTWSAATPKLESYTVATLPAAGTAGRLARVTDDIRGVWRDNGVQWVSVTGYADIAADFATGGAGTSISPWTGFESAVNALSANAIVHFRAGYYRPVNVSVTPKSGWTIGGEGWGSILLGSGEAGYDVIGATGVSNVTVKNLQIDGTGQTGSDAHGIRFINGSNILIDGVWVHHAAQDGIRFGPSGNNIGTVSNARIVNCTSRYNGQVGPSGQGIGATDFEKLVIANNILSDNLVNGMDLEPTATPETNNNASRVSITGNIVSGNAGSGINLYCSTVSTNIGWIAICGNTIVNNGGGYGVQLRSQSNIVVAGNLITASLKGVYVYNGTLYVSITGNTISHCNDGVLVSGVGTANTKISGNVIHDCTNGVIEASSADYTSVTGNHFRANTTDITLVGTHSESSENLPGPWITPTYAAGNFSSDSGSWTVDVGDIGTYAYRLSGRTMTVAFTLSTTSVTGTPTVLKIKIPAGAAAVKTVGFLYACIDNGGAQAAGYGYVTAADTWITLKPTVAGTTTWATATNTTQVVGSVTFEV